MTRFKFLMAAAMLLPSAAVSAGVLYNNTILSGAASGFCNNCILVDDVLVPSARDPADLPLAITSATVGILGIGSGTLSLYSFPVASDGSPVPTPTLIGTIFASFTGAVQTETFGNGSNTLATVEPNFTAQPGFGLLYIGFQADADWLWANGPDANLPTSYLYNGSGIFLDVSMPPLSAQLVLFSKPRRHARSRARVAGSAGRRVGRVARFEAAPLSGGCDQYLLFAGRQAILKTPI